MTGNKKEKSDFSFLDLEMSLFEPGLFLNISFDLTKIGDKG